MSDFSQTLQQQIEAAYQQQQCLNIVGGNSKAFYGRVAYGETLSVAPHQGILSYEPSELVLSARAGTPLSDINATLAEHHQQLAFEPPQYGKEATWGGTIACGLSGAARPYVGSMRDFVLGVRCLNGKGEVLKFGGQVMKNVAGYDISRLMVGALGTLGVLLDVACKVMPRDPETETRVLTCHDPNQALNLLQQWGNQNIPLKGSAYDGEHIYLRLAGLAIDKALQRVGGEVLSDADRFWTDLREQHLAFFATDKPLWRLSLPVGAPVLSLAGETWYEWGGALRWLRTDESIAQVRHEVVAAGGHATLFKCGHREDEIFQPLPAAMAQLQQRIKTCFDPAQILNRGRLYRNELSHQQ